MAVNSSSLGLLTVSNPGSSFSRTKLWRVPTVVRAATFSQDVSSYLISRTLVIERDYDVGELLTRTGATSAGIPTTAGRFRAAATRRSKE